jgi:nicotinamide-nucleotide amidase
MFMIFDKNILASIGKKLKAKKQTVAVAESATSGLLQFAFSQMPDASEFFQGGITAYNLGQKFKHLNVEPIKAEACDCVSQDVSNEMAIHASQLFKSDWGISITGYATPVPDSGNKLFCYYSIAFRGKVKAKGKMVPKKKKSDEVQEEYAERVVKRFGGLI